MSLGLFTPPLPKNESVLSYAPNSVEKKEIKKELEKQKNNPVEIPLIIGGEKVFTNDTGNIVSPHDHKTILGKYLK